MKLFVPDWEERVDPGYDFATDRFSLGRDPYWDDLYAHEIMGRAAYDGILVSRMAWTEIGQRLTRAKHLTMRGYLRLPDGLELFGDCGAFGYLGKQAPPFSTREMLDYYDHFAFDYGVSVDHLIVPEYASEAHRRYDLTLRNADNFLSMHRASRYSFVPVGAIQGWDVVSYIEASRHLVQSGYTYLAVGGVARSNTRTVESIVRAVRDTVGDRVRLHVLGVARAKLLPLFVELGITSVDSAAPIRCAWLSAHENYFTLEGSYAAIRIPIAEQERPKPETLVGRSSASLGTLRRAESEALRALRLYNKRQLGLPSALDAILAYDDLLAERRDAQTRSSRAALYRATLRARPWRRCDCPICRDLGVEVIIFRGNNRNRRRGFHNCYVVRKRLEALSAPIRVPANTSEPPNMS